MSYMKGKKEELRLGLLRLMQDKFERCRLDETGLRDDLRLGEDLLIDSIMIVQLIVYIELELGLSVPDAEVDPRAFATVGSLLAFMEELEPVAANGSEHNGGAERDEAFSGNR